MAHELDFSRDFWISVGISGFQLGFLDFRWISNGFLDFTWISGFRAGFLDFGLDFCASVRDFSRVGPLGFSSRSVSDHVSVTNNHTDLYADLRNCDYTIYSRLVVDRVWRKRYKRYQSR